MANKKPDDRLITHYGRMNRISKPMIGPVIDLDESSTIEVLTEMAKEGICQMSLPLLVHIGHRY